MKPTHWFRLPIATFMCVSALWTMAFAQDQGHWTPEVAMINHVEELLRKMPPPTYASVKADPFDDYARYYTGEIKDGRKLIVASFYSNSMDRKEYSPGMYIGPEHMVSTGGGCHHLLMLYNVAQDSVTQFVCYGLG